jgi:hypothetical protein
MGPFISIENGMLWLQVKTKTGSSEEKNGPKVVHLLPALAT